MLDYQIFSAINNLAGRWAALDWVGIFCAKYLIFFIFFIAALIVLFGKKEKIGQFLFAVKIFLAGTLAYALKLFILLFYNRPRPFAMHTVTQLIDKSSEGSFPSSHATVAFAIAFSIYFYNKKWGAAFLILATLVGLGRVYVGVHYPFDILGGVLIGWLAASIMEKIFITFRFKK